MSADKFTRAEAREIVHEQRERIASETTMERGFALGIQWRAASRITVTRKGEFVRVQAHKGTSGTPIASHDWKRSAFKAGDDDVLIANRAAERMAEKIGAAGFWVGYSNGPDCYQFTPAETERLAFTVRESAPALGDLAAAASAVGKRMIAVVAAGGSVEGLKEAIDANTTPAKPKRGALG